MSQNAIETSFDPKSLPLPVTADTDGSATRRIDARGAPAVSAAVALSIGLVAVSPDQPRATLLFVGASVVAIVLYFVIVPDDDEQAHSVVTTLLRRLPDVLTATGSILIMLGIGFAFPGRALALASLYTFAFFAGLPALKMIEIGPRTVAVLYGISLVSLVPFVILVCAG